MPEKIVGMQIPDSDVPEWIEVLRQGGELSQNQIDLILSGLNKSYRDVLQNSPKAELERFAGEILNDHGITITPESRQQIVEEILKQYETENDGN